jgi:ATP-dependent DNA helicase RecG
MKGKKAPTARALMELAVQTMRLSVPEPRPDGKASPKVGAVLLKADGTVETSSRGELRHGDHAEYTLLERKNRGNKLDGSTLFATLEPCAPGSRRHPKVDCSERIRLARIKEVWVGIQDPDPTVSRKGIQHLIDNGIKVQMFDRDLQEIIEKENEEFLKQASMRAAAVEMKPKRIVLSSLENKIQAAVLRDFSDGALALYRERAKIQEEVGSDEFNRRLIQLGLLKEEHDRLIPTGFGILLFGKEPRTAMRQAGLLALIEYPNGDQEREEFDKPAVMIPGLVEEWLKNKLPNIMVRDSAIRDSLPALPYEMIREAVVNALIHRDYSIDGSKCQLTVTQHTIAVKSPGRPVEPITIEQLQSFAAPMLSRNPEMHFIFSRMGMAEEQGLGLRSLRNRARSLHLPLPIFDWIAPYLVLTLYRTAESAAQTLAEDVLRSLSESEKKGWQWLRTEGKTNSAKYARAVDVDIRTARRHLGHFRRLGLVSEIGSGPKVEYEVV